jgi:hypothetical protein
LLIGIALLRGWRRANGPGIGRARAVADDLIGARRFPNRADLSVCCGCPGSLRLELDSASKPSGAGDDSRDDEPEEQDALQGAGEGTHDSPRAASARPPHYSATADMCLGPRSRKQRRLGQYLAHLLG